ncbi:MAG: DUF6177 family protein [Bifidobacteriaceae bacterium]|jgi:hypothetical protein|nr:DUF6177 family protein [Bifidobacteriaceae bacterium]
MDPTDGPGGRPFGGQLPNDLCDVSHVLADAATDAQTQSLAQTETRQTVVWLSRARQSLLRRCSGLGRRPILVSDGLSELTEPMRQALRYHGGGWAVRGGDGVMRNGLTGRRLRRPADALRLDPVDDPNDLAMAYLRPLHADHAELMVNLSVRHPPGPAPLPGEPVEILLTSLTGEAPAAFGRAEPALTPWDAAEIGWLCDRDQAAGARRSVFIAAGPAHAPASLVMAVERSETYTSEQVSGLVGLGPLERADLGRRLARADQTLASLARSCDVAFALVWTRAGHGRLTLRPVMPSAPVPLAILLGRGLVEGLGVDRRRAAAHFRGAAATRGGGLMIPFETDPAGGGRLPQLVRDVGLARATPQMGLSRFQHLAVDYAARY